MAQLEFESLKDVVQFAINSVREIKSKEGFEHVTCATNSQAENHRDMSKKSKNVGSRNLSFDVFDISEEREKANRKRR